eukprot:GFYU01008749.1.p1 GENE.GFYU01008749.1~~GFYU01008749.1.p1  ORF type:complete len:445 (+),score=6.44 GFYU01008749.1:106-1335(+)
MDKKRAKAEKEAEEDREQEKVHRGGPPQKMGKLILRRGSSGRLSQRTGSMQSLSLSSPRDSEVSTPGRTASTGDSDMESGGMFSDSYLDEDQHSIDCHGSAESRYLVAFCEHYLRVVAADSERARQLEQRVSLDQSTTFEVNTSKIAAWKVHFLNICFWLYTVLVGTFFCLLFARLLSSTEWRGEGCVKLSTVEPGVTEIILGYTFHWVPPVVCCALALLFQRAMITQGDWWLSTLKYQWLFIQRQWQLLLLHGVQFVTAVVLHHYDTSDTSSVSRISLVLAYLFASLIFGLFDIILLFFGSQRAIRWMMISLALLCLNTYMKNVLWQNRCGNSSDSLVVRLSGSIELVANSAYMFKLVTQYCWVKMQDSTRPFMPFRTERLYTNDAHQEKALATQDWDPRLTFAYPSR